MAGDDAAAAAATPPSDEFLEGLLNNLETEHRAGPQRAAPADEELPQAAALEQLASALEQLAGGLGGSELDELVSADEYTHIDQDADVFEALSVDDILRMVTTQTTEQSDSDEYEENNFVEPSLNASQAIDCARDVHEYVMAVPEAVAPADVTALDDIMRKMMHVS
jgi:hypothetical protein